MKLYINESEKKDILSLYGLSEQKKTNPDRFTEMLKVFNIQSGSGGSPSGVGKCESVLNDGGAFYDCVASAIIYDTEIAGSNKNQWPNCKKWEITVNGSFFKDYEKKNFCSSFEMGTAQKWPIDESDPQNPKNPFQVLYKTYGTHDYQNILAKLRLIPRYKTREDKAFKYLDDNKHEILLAISIGSMILPFIAGGYFFAGATISLLADMTDLGFYIKEQDWRNAGLAAIFLMVPINTLSKKLGIPLSPKIIREFLERTIGKVGKPFSKVDELIKSKLTTNTVAVLTRYSRTYGLLNLLSALLNKKRSLKVLMSFLKSLGGLGYGITKIGITIGGMVYTYNQIYDYFMMEDKSKFKQIESQYRKDSKSTNDLVLSQVQEKLLAHIDSAEYTNEKLESIQGLVQVADTLSDAEMDDDFLDLSQGL